MIIFEIDHNKFIMPSEEQAMKAFEVFKGAKPLDHYFGKDAESHICYKLNGSLPEIKVSITPDEALLENNVRAVEEPGNGAKP